MVLLRESVKLILKLQLNLRQFSRCCIRSFAGDPFLALETEKESFPVRIPGEAPFWLHFLAYSAIVN